MNDDDRTVFKRVDFNLGSLLHYIQNGDMGLPDIQRPFRWTAAKVRDLFDSMYRGFPVGYLLFWANAETAGARQIGLDDKPHKVPGLLIVDGQQRLTSLYAVVCGKPVVDEDYQERRIEIAFRPRDGKFEVCDAAIRNDPEFIPDISVLWTNGKSSWSLVNDFLATLEMKRGLLSPEEKETIGRNLDQLVDLQSYPFTALEIAAAVTEEQVADIFVRVNSQGVKLNQADFILTLMSVFAEDLRIQLEDFCRASRKPQGAGPGASPYNHFVGPSPDQLLRVAIALGFHRARLKSVYQILRGKDVQTDRYLAEKRDQQFARLRESQAEALHLTHWHQFFSALVGAGFRSGELVSSEIALFYSYALYLIGKTRYNLPEYLLDRLVGQWFYSATLSGRYSGSPETIMESDLNRLRDLPSPAAFVAAMEKVVSETLTGDFWTITLPGELETSSTQSPVLLAYYAAQNKLGAPVLFSHKKIGDLLDPSITPRKRLMDRHHLFPRAWLESQGVQDLTVINQIANLAFVEWPDDIDISDNPPVEYVPRMRARFSPADWEKMCRLHALPADWESLPYEEFLSRRRVLMAEIIRLGFETLASSGK